MSQQQDVIVIGFGPAGLGASLGAYAAGLRKIQVLDPSPTIGSGSLAGIGIESNSRGEDFVEEYRRDYPRALDLPEAQPLAGNEGAVKLAFAADFLRSVAHCAVEDGIVDLVPEAAQSVTVTPRGYIVRTQDQAFIAPRLIVAPGAREELLSELTVRKPETVFVSRDVLGNERNGELDAALAKRNHVAVIGNAHGAYSVADELIQRYPDVRVDILKKSRTKPFFTSVAEAQEYGYHVSARDSVCPETGYINRFDGIRGRARSVWLREQNDVAPNVKSYTDMGIDEIDPDVAIVQATGYTPRSVKFLKANGRHLSVQARPTERGFAELQSGDYCRLDGAYGLGLGHSGCDGTGVYQRQARELFSLGR